MSSSLRSAGASTAPAAVPGQRSRRQATEWEEQVEARPHTCPSLTPQFHWNFNARAVESLSEQEVARVYRLFRFYDSSTLGDSLPSINCRRFLQVLRDGHLIGSSPSSSLPHSYSGARGGIAGADLLSVATVEKIFAEAVMGKLRTYLDADGQPTLTFHLFCGALMNCAITILPSHRCQPEIAMQQLLDQLFTTMDRYAQERQQDLYKHKSLLQHFPPEGLNALWYQGDAHGAVRPAVAHTNDADGDGMESHGAMDFRTLAPFQQVISTFSLDVVHESRAQERAQQQYTIPPDLAAHFSPEILRFVIERFQVFDVFDRGKLPRQEMLPLLMGLVKKLEISNMYEVLTLLLTGDNFSRHGPAASQGPGASHHSSHSAVASAEISLIQILQAIHTCRRPRHASSYSSMGRSHKTASRTPAGNHAHDVGSSSEHPGEPGEDELDGAMRSDSIGSSSSQGVSAKKPNRKSKACPQRQPTVSKINASGKTPKSGNPASSCSTNGRKGKKQIDLHRRHSILLKDDELEASAAHPPQGTLSRRTSKKTSDSQIRLDDVQSSNRNLDSSDTLTVEPGHHLNQSGGNDGRRLEVHQVTDSSPPSAMHRHGSMRKVAPVAIIPSATTAASVALDGEPSSSELDPCPQSSATPPARGISNDQQPTTFKIFMLLGGDHDGAICCTIELTLPSRYLEETRGVFFQNTPPEILERAQVLPAQPNTESAIRMLKKRIEKREKEGFALHPSSQLQQLDALLAEIRARNPHYASALTGNRGCSSGDHKLLASPTPYGVTADNCSPVSTKARERRSLDRAGTCVRQPSDSDLLAQLSDSHTHHGLKTKKREVTRGCSGGDLRDPREHLPLSQTTETRFLPPNPAPNDSLAWIHAVNDSIRGSRGQEELPLRSSASTPSLSNSPMPRHILATMQQPSKVQKPHPGIQLQPIQ